MIHKATIELGRLSSPGVKYTGNLNESVSAVLVLDLLFSIGRSGSLFSVVKDGGGDDGEFSSGLAQVGREEEER